MEGKGIRKDGQEFTYEGSTFKLELQGEFVLTVMLRDISERKKKEEELVKIRTALDNSSDAIAMTDINLKIVYQNQSFLDLFGYTVDEINRKGIINVYKGVDVIDNALQVLQSGKRWEGEIRTQSKDGRERTCLLSTSPILDDKDNAIGYFSIHTDITDRKRMELQLLQSEKLKSLGELAAGVAHDFNNVLAAILGRAQLLKMIVEPPPGKEEKRKSAFELKKGLEVIEQASLDGAETVRRIQEFARRRDEDKHFTTVDLNEIIDNALDFTRMKWKDNAESKGIKISIQKEFSTLPTTSGSASELREVFTNLINNSIDAMPQGGSIKMKTFKEDSHISIKVEDTGVGIPKTMRDRVFDPFFTTKGVQSSGLGLSVSYGIINRHRGTISADSIEGKGTTFTIKLPISEKVIETEQVKPIPEEQRKAKILVIEDEENVRDILSAILIEGGHQVETAIDGSQGIEMFEKKEFDLVFSDLGMPGMSGWQVAEKIKSINKNVPVALITGWNVEQKESEMRESGVDLIVYKPFEVKQVFKLVQEGMILKDRFKAA
jgi:PAS domain S-box-containing protein